MTGTYQHNRTYEYRSARVAGIWLFVATACVMTIAWGYNQYQVQAQSNLAEIQQLISDGSKQDQPQVASQAQVVATAQPTATQTNLIVVAYRDALNPCMPELLAMLRRDVGRYVYVKLADNRTGEIVGFSEGCDTLIKPN